MGQVLPTLHQLAGAGGTLVATLLFLLLGGIACRRQAPEIRLLAGWGIACLLLTLWGALTPADLRWPLAGLAVAALLAQLHTGLRAPVFGWAALGRAALLGLPLLLILLAMAPSQVDTWLNLLPNAAYLADHHQFPAHGRPESFSFIAVAPYNTQFVAFIASVLTGSFAETAMGLFNLVLLLAAGLMLARLASGAADGATPPWWSIALGLLIAVPLDPGFAPRVFLAPYGETGLAVTALAGILLGTRGLLRQARGDPWPGEAVALALVLAAQLNIKQSGIGLVLGMGGAWLILLLLTHIPRRRAAIACWFVTLVPALALYALWRWYVAAHLPEGELQPRAFADWNTGILPGILLAMAREIFHRPLLFLLGLAVLLLGARRWRHTGAGFAPRFFQFTGLLCLAQLGFLTVTYIVHFPPDWALQAHSLFRYFSQLALAILAALALALRPWLQARLYRWPVPRRRVLAAALLLLVMLLSLPAWSLLRIDAEAPQPQIAAFMQAAAADITAQDRVGLVIPGPGDDSAPSFLRGLLLFLPPRVHPAGFTTQPEATPAALAALRAAGATLVIVSCAPQGLAGIPPRQGGVLRWDGSGWERRLAVTWPVELARQHFASLIPKSVLCF